jgi:hypothetical protein
MLDTRAGIELEPIRGRLSLGGNSRDSAGTDSLSFSNTFWRRGWESNPRIKVLQTSPLPLGYRALLITLPRRSDEIQCRGYFIAKM